jgi:hypothetical protein
MAAPIAAQIGAPTTKAVLAMTMSRVRLAAGYDAPAGGGQGAEASAT